MLAVFAKYASRTYLAAIEEVQLTLGQWVGVTMPATGRRLIPVCTYVRRRYAHVMARSPIGRHHFAFFSSLTNPPSELPITLSLLVRCPACMTAIPSLATELCLRAQDLPPGHLSMPRHPTLWHNPGHWYVPCLQ